MPLVTLVGYRGSGKSSVATHLAKLLGCSWQDADDVLEREAGQSIAALVASRGEAFFRDLESAVLGRMLAREQGVLATGGGVVLRATNRDLLHVHGRPVVWLQAPPAVLRPRIAADPASAARRPALTGTDPLAEVEAAVAAREPLYRAVADGIIDVSDDPAQRIAVRIAAWLDRFPRPDHESAAAAGEAIP